MEINSDQFNTVKQNAEAEYEKIRKVYCPFFKESVHFNSKGLEHLIFKKWNKTRLIQDQFTRFKYLKYAPLIIENSKTLQGIKEVSAFERIKRNSKWHQVLKQVTYYEFIAIVDIPNSKVRLKVIVKQVEDNERYFFSIIPFWGIDKNSKERILYAGSPESD